MGFFFTLLYITTAFITPSVLFGPLAPYHIEVAVAVLAVVFTIPALPSSGLGKIAQTYAVLGMAVAVVFSFVGNLYFGGAPPALYDYTITAMGFFLAAINCRKPIHLTLIVLCLFLCSTFYIVRGGIDMVRHVPVSNYVLDPETLPRLRGLGIVHDPNDFSQVMVSLLPLLFLWRSASWFKNLFLIGLPLAVLITGMYLTHSRGASIALAVVCAAAARRKLGTIPSVIIAALLLGGVLALGWSGGRAVDLQAGADRLDAWTVGIELIKHHPLFGVGLHRFADFNYITAHNSVVVCAAEIGIPGFFCWILFLFSTFRLGVLPSPTTAEAIASSEPAPATGRIPSAAEMWRLKRSAPTAQPNEPAHDELATTRDPIWPRLAGSPGAAPILDPTELRRIMRLLVISIIGFLAAGWFLSRAISIWLFLFCGMLCAAARMTAENGVPVRHDKPLYSLRWTLIISVALLFVVYILLHIRATGG